MGVERGSKYRRQEHVYTVSDRGADKVLYYLPMAFGEHRDAVVACKAIAMEPFGHAQCLLGQVGGYDLYRELRALGDGSVAQYDCQIVISGGQRSHGVDVDPDRVELTWHAGGGAVHLHGREKIGVKSGRSAQIVLVASSGVCGHGGWHRFKCALCGIRRKNSFNFYSYKAAVGRRGGIVRKDKLNRDPFIAKHCELSQGSKIVEL